MQGSGSVSAFFAETTIDNNILDAHAKFPGKVLPGFYLIRNIHLRWNDTPFPVGSLPHRQRMEKIPVWQQEFLRRKYNI